MGGSTHPEDINSFGGGLVVSTRFLPNNSVVVENIVLALLEALASCLSGRNQNEVMQAFKTALSITDEESAVISLGELRRKPYPSLAPLAKMRSVISIHDLRILKVQWRTSLKTDLFGGSTRMASWPLYAAT